MKQNFLWTRIIVFANVGLFLLGMILGTLLEINFLELFSIHPVKIAQGEWYRFITALFYHHGMLHFCFNVFALWAIGQRLEPVMGQKLYLYCYFGAGLTSFVASLHINQSQGLGASGALFGLIGAGLVMELYALKKQGYFNSLRGPKDLWSRLRQSPFVMIVLVNYLIAIVFNLVSRLFDLHILIDNAAHTGGLVFGVLVGFLFLASVRRKLGLKRALWALSGLLLIGAFYIGTDKGVIVQSLKRSEAALEQSMERVYLQTRILGIVPEDKEILFRRMEGLLYAGELRYVLSDLKKLGTDAEILQRLSQLVRDLLKDEKTDAAQFIQSYLVLQSESKEPMPSVLKP